MPWTLYWYILKDLLKLLTVAAVVLVLVISLAAAIKPLSEGFLSPAALARYLSFLAPTMLGYIAPFAGTFAVTLVFTRLAADNELIACRASGMSYGVILLPVVVLGLAMTVGLAYLSHWVVPSFYRQAASMLENDLTQVMVRQIRQRRAVELGDLVIYADGVDDSQTPPVLPGSTVQPTKLIRLRGVAAGRVDEQGRLRSDSTAEAADVLLYPVDGESWVEVILKNVMYHDPLRGDLVVVENWTIPAVKLPSPFRDSPRFLSWPELRTLGDHPERFDRVRKQKQALAAAIASEQLLQLIRTELQTPTGASLQGPQDPWQYRLTSPHTRREATWLALTSNGVSPVRVEYRVNHQLSRRIEAKSGTLWAQGTQLEPEPWVRIELQDARVYDARLGGFSAEHKTLPTLRCRHDQPLFAPLINQSCQALLTTAEHPPYASAASVRRAADGLRAQINRLLSKADAQRHERAATAISCCLVVLLGAILGVVKQTPMPLVVYFWSFLSAIVVVIIIHSGANLMSAPDVPRAQGLSILWSGNALLAITVALAYRYLRRT